MQEENKVNSNHVETDQEKWNEYEEYDVFEDTLPPNMETKSKNKLLSTLFDILIYAAIIFACIFIIPTYVMQRTIVDGPSMENTLHNGENLLVEKISYRMDGLKRFDIIVFYPFGREVNEYYVKRIIALPGETIQIVGSEIYIDGELLEEEYGKDPIAFQGLAKDPITLEEDEFFVLGDNRDVSYDSRYEEVGLVSKENIGGRAILRIWPLKKFGTID